MAQDKKERFGQVPALLVEYAQLEKDLADPSIHGDQGKARQLGKRYAALGPVIGGYRAFKSAEDDLAAGKEMAAEDDSFASEIPALEASLAAAEEKTERVRTLNRKQAKLLAEADLELAAAYKIGEKY